MQLIDTDGDDTIRLAVDDAFELGKNVLIKIGYSPDEAVTITQHLVDNSMCGYAFAGLPRILAIADSPELQKPRSPVTITHETPVSALLDGGNHVGYISVNRDAEVAIDKVSQSGIADRKSTRLKSSH